MTGEREIEIGQVKRIHGLLAAMGLANDKDFKRDLIAQYSGGRETSTKGLTVNEAGELITHLQALAQPRSLEEQKCDERRKLMIYYCHQMNWYVQDNEDVASGGKRKVDVQRLNDWCVKYGQFHKPLMAHSSVELSHVLVQLERVYRDYLEAVTR